MEVATKPAGRRGTGRRSRSQSVAAQDCDGFQRLDAHLKSELLVRSSYKEIAACSVACKELNSLAVANHVWTPHLAKKYGLQLKGLDQPSTAARIFKLLHASGLGEGSSPDGRKVKAGGVHPYPVRFQALYTDGGVDEDAYVRYWADLAFEANGWGAYCSKVSPNISALGLLQVHSSEEEALLQRRRFYALACQVCAGRLLARVPFPASDTPLNNRQQRFFNKTVASLLRWPTRALEKLFAILYQHRRAGALLGQTLDISLLHHVAQAVAAESDQGGALPSGPASPCGRVLRSLYSLLGPEVPPRPGSLAARAADTLPGHPQLSTSGVEGRATRSRAGRAAPPTADSALRARVQQQHRMDTISTWVLPELDHLFEQAYQLTLRCSGLQDAAPPPPGVLLNQVAPDPDPPAPPPGAPPPPSVHGSGGITTGLDARQLSEGPGHLEVFHREVAARLTDPRRVAGYTAVFDTVAISRTGNFTCPVRCGALLVGAVSAATHACPRPGPAPATVNRTKPSGDNPEDAAVRTYLGCIARQASSSALDGCQTVEQVLAQVAAGKLPRVQRLMILPHAEYIEFEPAPPEAGAAGAAAAAAGGGGSALQGGGEAAPPVPLQPVVWFRYYTRSEALHMVEVIKQLQKLAAKTLTHPETQNWDLLRASLARLGEEKLREEQQQQHRQQQQQQQRRSHKGSKGKARGVPEAGEMEVDDDAEARAEVGGGSRGRGAGGGGGRAGGARSQAAGGSSRGRSRAVVTGTEVGEPPGPAQTSRPAQPRRRQQQQQAGRSKEQQPNSAPGKNKKGQKQQQQGRSKDSGAPGPSAGPAKGGSRQQQQVSCPPPTPPQQVVAMGAGGKLEAVTVQPGVMVQQVSLLEAGWFHSLLHAQSLMPPPVDSSDEEEEEGSGSGDDDSGGTSSGSSSSSSDDDDGHAPDSDEIEAMLMDSYDSDEVFTTDDDSGLFVGSVDMEDDDDDGDELGGIGDDAMMGPMAFEDEAAPMGVEPPADMDDMLDMLGYGPMPQPPPAAGAAEPGDQAAAAAAAAAAGGGGPADGGGGDSSGSDDEDDGGGSDASGSEGPGFMGDSDAVMAHIFPELVDDAPPSQAEHMLVIQLAQAIGLHVLTQTHVELENECSLIVDECYRGWHEQMMRGSRLHLRAWDIETLPNWPGPAGGARRLGQAGSGVNGSHMCRLLPEDETATDCHHVFAAAASTIAAFNRYPGLIRVPLQQVRSGNLVCIKLIAPEDRMQEMDDLHEEPNIDLGFVAFQGLALQLPPGATVQ